jgi:hypothetical protein
MMELLNLPRILEVSFGLLNATTGIVVLLLARRIAPTLTLYMHQRAMQILVIIAGLIVLSEFVAILQPFFRSSTFADVAEELAELLAISSGGFALYLMSRARRGRLFEAIGGRGRPDRLEQPSLFPPGSGAPDRVVQEQRSSSFVRGDRRGRL